MVQFISIPGASPYGEVLKLQHELVERRIRDEIPDTVIFLEHRPTITRGRGLQWREDRKARSLPIDLSRLHGVEYFEIERGGDLTYHGPGQLVVYPIIKLSDCDFEFCGDLGKYLKTLEKWTSNILSDLEVQAESISGATGVWVEEKKIASIGVAVRRWVSFHGLALNVNNSLEAFRQFHPCGFSGDKMTRVRDVLSDRPEVWAEDWNGKTWRKFWEEAFISQMDGGRGRYSTQSRTVGVHPTAFGRHDAKMEPDPPIHA